VVVVVVQQQRLTTTLSHNAVRQGALSVVLRLRDAEAEGC